MIPVLTPQESAALDAASVEPIDVLVARAGRAVASVALSLLGGGYGRRVIVVAGPGNNGADGRVAAQLLARRGVKVQVVEARDVTVAGVGLGRADLVIDAAFGTGLRADVTFPDVDGAPVLAVDIPSGIDGLTGAARGAPARAVATVTFVAPAPGLVMGEGPAHAGEVLVADIGLDPSGARAALVEDSDVVTWVPRRSSDDHKWRHAVWLIAGSAGMRGAGRLSASAAMRGGAGYVRCSSPDGMPDCPTEAVGVELSRGSWADDVVQGAARFGCVAIGPGLGRDADVARGVRDVVRRVAVPVVVDGDGLAALGRDVTTLLAERRATDGADTARRRVRGTDGLDARRGSHRRRPAVLGADRGDRAAEGGDDRGRGARRRRPARACRRRTPRDGGHRRRADRTRRRAPGARRRTGPGRCGRRTAARPCRGPRFVALPDRLGPARPARPGLGRARRDRIDTSPLIDASALSDAGRRAPEAVHGPVAT